MKEPLVEYPDNILLKSVRKLPDREDKKRQIAFEVGGLPERGRFTTAQILSIWRRELRVARDDPKVGQYWIGGVVYYAGPAATGMEGSFMKIVRNYHAFYREVLDRSGPRTVGELGDRSFVYVDGFDLDPDASVAEVTLADDVLAGLGRAL